MPYILFSIRQVIQFISNIKNCSETIKCALSFIKWHLTQSPPPPLELSYVIIILFEFNERSFYHFCSNFRNFDKVCTRSYEKVIRTCRNERKKQQQQLCVRTLTIIVFLRILWNKKNYRKVVNRLVKIFVFMHDSFY